MRADDDNTLEMRGPKTKTIPVELAEDIVLVELFTAPTAPPHKPRECVKRHRSSCIIERDEACARKNEREDLEAARIASLIDEESRQMRDCELACRTSSSKVDFVERSTTKGADTAVGTTEDVPTEGVGSGKPDPPAH